MLQSLVPAAQYLRMSTDHQQYSLVNQADAIARYAAKEGFHVVKTYSDAARSGLQLNNRSGLKQLLRDVMEGYLEFRVILVYDVSRWGRFQDTDEAAHYEYLCKSGGAPIHYCAEVFPNDNSVAGMIMKSLKRTMAREYSRELSVKVQTGMFRLARLGFRVGGSEGYGFRRQLLDLNGIPKQVLGQGECKSITTDRVILIPGPAEEIKIVRRIFQEFVEKQESVRGIAMALNRKGVPFRKSTKWDTPHIKRILQNPQYCGTQVWSRTTAVLSTPMRRLPPEKWAVCPNAFRQIVSRELFERAQARFASFTWKMTEDQLLEKLREVMRANNGKISLEIIDSSPLCPSGRTYYQRFGGLANAYLRLGILRPNLISTLSTRQTATLIRKQVVEEVLKEFPAELEEVRRPSVRSLLKVRKTGRLVAVKLALSHTSQYCGKYWLLDCHQDRQEERDKATLVAFLDPRNEIEQMRIFRCMSFPTKSIRLYDHHNWLERGIRLGGVSDFMCALEKVD